MRLLTTTTITTTGNPTSPSVFASTTKHGKSLVIKTEQYIGSPSTIRCYAILSHTWDEATEVTFQELPLFTHAPIRHYWLQVFAVFFPQLVCGVFLSSIRIFGSSPSSDLVASFTVLFATSLSFVIHYTINLNSDANTQGTRRLIEQKQPGYAKIQQTLHLARCRGIDHAWVDTCCIDKTSSAELAEAIRSMYSWYASAQVCFVYLADLEPVSAQQSPEEQRQRLEQTLPKCRWFERGWTLQELIAPKNVVFFDREWNERGTKTGLSGILAEITGIPEDLLKGEAKLSDYSVARRMSWASMRETKRVEDMAYCLMGIFNVSMSLIYGEGMEAFYRLQEAIVEESADLSIFVWKDGAEGKEEKGEEKEKEEEKTEEDKAGKRRLWAPMFAESPRQFADSGIIEVELTDSIYRDLRSGTRGIQAEVSLICLPDKAKEDDGNKCILDVFCKSKLNGMAIGVMVRKISGGRYVRYKPWKLSEIGRGFARAPWQDMNRTLVETATLAKKLDTEFPFCKGFDPVLGNRHNALKLRLGSSKPEFTVDQCRAMPRTHWDIHDNIFFSTNRTSKAWCGFFIHGQLAHGPSTCIPVNIFLGCIRWNVKRSLIILASLEDLEPKDRIYLEYHLDGVRFESCRMAESIMMSVLRGESRDANALSTVVETSVADKSEIRPANDGGTVFDGGRIFQTNGPSTSTAAWHYRVRSNGEKARVEVSVEQLEERHPGICNNPVNILEIRLRLLE
ncbi:putative vegetative incompatibility protein [Triangularia setosa]|uniref:Vegetative incompatibility protein n=1 Tax=Triangularia setosa TaxID=2587417 RepID=A0AAN6W497_9PEZI|nr:putative vegetative incompatibility protein [Podospora setosa]